MNSSIVILLQFPASGLFLVDKKNFETSIKYTCESNACPLFEALGLILGI